MSRLVLAAHGSVDPGHARVVTAIAESVRQRLGPDMPVAVGYLDHGEPRLGEVAHGGDVVVPLLLSAGYHAAVDIPAVVGAGVTVAAPLGPDPRLAQVCAERLRESGYPGSIGNGPVVLAAAGSADPRAAADVSAVAAMLAEILDRPVLPAYLSAASPTLADVLPAAAAVVTYLLAPGRFADQAAAAARVGGQLVTGVLGNHPLIAEIVVDRARSASLA